MLICNQNGWQQSDESLSRGRNDWLVGWTPTSFDAFSVIKLGVDLCQREMNFALKREKIGANFHLATLLENAVVDEKLRERASRTRRLRWRQGERGLRGVIGQRSGF